MAFGAVGRRVIGCAVVALVVPMAVCLPLASPIEPALDAAFVGFLLCEVLAILAIVAFLAPARFPAVDRVLAAVVAVGVTGLAASSLAGTSPSASWIVPLLLVLAVGFPALRFAIRGGARAAAGAPLVAAAPPAGPVGEVGACFAEKLAWLVATRPELAPQGVLAPSGSGRVLFPKPCDDGFDVAVLVEPDAVTVFAGGFAHVRFEEAAGDPAAVAAGAIAWVRDLLGPDARLRERLSGGAPYLARVELRTPEGWRRAFVCWNLFWNYFGRRTERVLVNRREPVRDPSPEPDPSRTPEA